MKTVRPSILLVANQHDFTTDHVAYQLKEKSKTYFRLNIDQLASNKITLFPMEPRLVATIDGINLEISLDTLKSIYFRAPTFLRDNYQPKLSPDEQFSRAQWATFVRSLTVFDPLLWVNHPQATYLAEIKPYQLKVAKEIGFLLPETVITNTTDNIGFSKEKNGSIVVKTIDPAILRNNGDEAFIFTNFVSEKELMKSKISSSPIIIQETLWPKIDIRVTVVDKKVFAVAIKKNGKGIKRDWRREKGKIQYENIKLDLETKNRCITLLARLDLKFGAIDLVYVDDQYFFLEINPTGEWAWLLSHTDHKIDEAIADCLNG